MGSEWSREWRGEEVRRGVREEGLGVGIVVMEFWKGGKNGGRVKAEIQRCC